MEQREDPGQRFMRVSVTARRPAAEQLALLLQEEGLAGEPAGVAGGQAPGGIGEDDLAAAGEAEELPQHGQPPLPRAGQGGEERLDVVHVGQCPVLLAPLAGEEQRKVPRGEGRELHLGRLLGE